VACAFALQKASVTAEVIGERVPLHVRVVPAWMERGTSSIKSASPDDA
jgi:hypothetical protein